MNFVEFYSSVMHLKVPIPHGLTRHDLDYVGEAREKQTHGAVYTIHMHSVL